MVLEPSYIKHGEEPTTGCKLFYPDAKKEFPADASTPLRNGIQITCFIDVDHAGDLITQQSCFRGTNLLEQRTSEVVQQETNQWILLLLAPSSWH